MYKRQGQEDTFYKLKPKLTDNQQHLLSCFYRLSQERQYSQGSPLAIKERDIYSYIEMYGSHGYPDDLFVMAVHSLDNEYIKQYCEEMKRKAKK